jgi:hypothetical protein
MGLGEINYFNGSSDILNNDGCWSLGHAPSTDETAVIDERGNVSDIAESLDSLADVALVAWIQTEGYTGDIGGDTSGDLQLDADEITIACADGSVVYYAVPPDASGNPNCTTFRVLAGNRDEAVHLGYSTASRVSDFVVESGHVDLWDVSIDKLFSTTPNAYTDVHPAADDQIAEWWHADGESGNSADFDATGQEIHVLGGIITHTGGGGTFLEVGESGTWEHEPSSDGSTLAEVIVAGNFDASGGDKQSTLTTVTRLPSGTVNIGNNAGNITITTDKNLGGTLIEDGGERN